MAVFIAQNMAPIMFVSLVLFLLLGYPVAFSLAACGLFYFVVGVELAPLSGGNINLSWPLLQSLPERIYGIMNNDVLLAIPFFTLMGLVLERSGSDCSSGQDRLMLPPDKGASSTPTTK